MNSIATLNFTPPLLMHWLTVIHGNFVISTCPTLDFPSPVVLLTGYITSGTVCFVPLVSQMWRSTFTLLQKMQGSDIT